MNNPADGTTIPLEAARSELPIPESPNVPERASRGSFSIVVLAVLAVLYTLYFARAFLLPIAFALLLDFLFSPVVRALARYKVRPPAAAGLIVIGLIAVASVGVYELAQPVQRWISDAPAVVGKAQTRIRSVLKPFDRVTRTAEQMERAAASVGGAQKTPSVFVERSPSLSTRFFGTTRQLVAAMFEVVILLYFLLAAGDLFLEKLIGVLPHLRDKKTAVRIARATESSISTYLLTTATINIGEGVVVGGVMALLGMPNAILWGSLAALFEFIPYLGALAMAVILSIAALTVFDDIGRALLVPAAFLAINLIQGNVVSPLLMGHRLSLNPVALFAGLSFWFWIWGLPGAFIAVPLLSTLKIVCDHIESLAPVGEFLGMRADKITTAASATAVPRQ